MSTASPLSLLTRTMAGLVLEHLRGKSAVVQSVVPWPSPNETPPVGALHVTAEVQIDSIDMLKSIDDVAERKLMPASYFMAGEIRRRKATKTYLPPMPKDGDAARYTIDGIAMLGTKQPGGYQFEIFFGC